jgi:hypothetical protein
MSKVWKAIHRKGSKLNSLGSWDFTKHVTANCSCANLLRETANNVSVSHELVMSNPAKAPAVHCGGYRSLHASSFCSWQLTQESDRTPILRGRGYLYAYLKGSSFGIFMSITMGRSAGNLRKPCHGLNLNRRFVFPQPFEAHYPFAFHGFD